MPDSPETPEPTPVPVPTPTVAPSRAEVLAQQRTAAVKPPKGVLPYKSIRVFAFAVISASIFACAVVLLLAVWDYATSGTAWRAVTSLGIIAGAMLSFVVVNEMFGNSIKPD